MTTAGAAPPKELSTRLLRTVPFLKRWASTPNVSSYHIAREFNIPDATLYQSILPEFLSIYSAAVKQPDFPSNIVTYYNQHGNPDPSVNLTEAEVHALRPVFQRELERKPEVIERTFYQPQPHQQTYAPPEQRTPNLGTNATIIA